MPAFVCLSDDFYYIIRANYINKFERLWKSFQDNETTITEYSNLSEIELAALLRYDKSVTGLNRDISLREWLQREDFNTYIAFKKALFVYLFYLEIYYFSFLFL